MFHLFNKTYVDYKSTAELDEPSTFVINVSDMDISARNIYLNVRHSIHEYESEHLTDANIFSHLHTNFRPDVRVFLIVSLDDYKMLYARWVREVFNYITDPNERDQLILDILDSKKKQLFFERGLRLTANFNIIDPHRYTVKGNIVKDLNELSLEFLFVMKSRGDITSKDVEVKLKSFLRKMIETEVYIFATETRYCLDNDTIKDIFGLNVPDNTDYVNFVQNNRFLRELYLERKIDIETNWQEYKRMFGFYLRDGGIRKGDEEIIDLMELYMNGDINTYDFSSQEFIGDLDGMYDKINMFLVAGVR